MEGETPYPVKIKTLAKVTTFNQSERFVRDHRSNKKGNFGNLKDRERWGSLKRPSKTRTS